MAKSAAVPPFLIDAGDDVLTFRFAREALEHGYEYPPNLEALIVNELAENCELAAPKQVHIDLEDLPAISSKQLGAMLAVRKACCADRKVRVVHLRPNVRELLQITKLNDFFEWDD
jgi:hypothetical protein